MVVSKYAESAKHSQLTRSSRIFLLFKFTHLKILWPVRVGHLCMGNTNKSIVPVYKVNMGHAHS